MLREYFKSWNKFEITLVLLGTIGVIVFGCIFKSAILAIICSIAYIVTAMLFDRYKIVKNCNCIITTNREDINISNKHNAIIFYNDKNPVRLVVINKDTEIFEIEHNCVS